MKINKLQTNSLTLAIFLSFATATMADSANFNPLRSPNSMPKNPVEMGLTCASLIVRYLGHPYTYNYRTDFGKDPYAGGAIIAGATNSFIGYAYPIFSLVRGIAEDNRIQSAENRIEHLRRIKAEKHCYEGRS